MKEDRFPRKHQLCTCPDWTPDFKGTPAPDTADCNGGAIAHPVIGVEALEEILEGLRKL